jgi:hypothetical protein
MKNSILLGLQNIVSKARNILEVKHRLCENDKKRT